MDTDLTPLGELLESAREARRPKLSQNAAARAAGTSPTTYRRIVRGVARLGGRDVDFEGTPERIASIAEVLHVTPEQLESVGRSDAAEELRAILEAPRSAAEEPSPAPSTLSARSTARPPAVEEMDISELRALLRRVDEALARLDERQRGETG